jgi:TP901 family phage tail tape measure protein
MLYHQTIISAQDYASPAFQRMAAASTAANMKIIKGTQAATASQIRFARVIEASRLAVSAFKTTLIMGAIGLAAIVGPTVMLTGKVAELEAALRHTVAIGGAEFQGHLWELNDTIIRVSRKWGLNTQNMAEGAVQLVKAGYSLEETVLLETVGVTAKAAGIDFGTASNIATYALTVWGYEVEDAMELMSKMSFVADRMIIDYEDFAEVLQYAGSSAVEAGVGFEELIVMAGVLSKTGKEAGMAARGIRRLLMDMLVDSDKFVAGFRKAGVEVDFYTKEGAINIQGIMKAYSEMTITAREYAAIMPQLSIREADALLGLKRHYGTFNELYQDTLKSSGYVFSVAEEQMKSLSSKIEMLKTSFTGIIMMPEFVEKLGIVLDSLANWGLLV